jgi:hypothetical protein
MGNNLNTIKELLEHFTNTKNNSIKKEKLPKPIDTLLLNPNNISKSYFVKKEATK